LAELLPLAPWPLPFLIFGFLILLPGAALANVVLIDRKVEAALFALLTIVLGLIAVSGTAFLWVAIANQHLSFVTLLVPSLCYSIGGGLLWWRGKRAEVVRTPWQIWLLLGLATLVVFLIHDGSVLVEAAGHWINAGRGNCFRLGTFQYLGLPSPIWAKTLPPMVDFWDGIMPGNLALSSLYTLLFGWPGLRLLHVTLALMFGLQGYLLGKRYSTNPLGGYIGLLVFTLNPFMLMVQDTDRNVLALAFGSTLYVLLVLEIGGPFLLGIIAGFTAGLGLQMLPLLFLIPVCWHLWHLHRRPSQIVTVVLCGVAVSALWLIRIGWYDPGPLNPLQTYELGFFDLRVQYVLGFPFYHQLTHGPSSNYPVFLTHLFYLYNTFGMALVGFGLLGIAGLAMIRRVELWTLLLFGLPSLFALGLKVFITPDQLRLVLVCLLPCLTGIAVGIIWLVSKPVTWHRVALIAVAFAVPYLVVMGLAQVRVPADPRFDDMPPPTGTDPVAAYMTEEARINLGMVPGKEPRAGPAPSVLKGKSDTSKRLDHFTWPALVPNYWQCHPLGRSDADRWNDLPFLRK
jgi:hypothetical protein